MKSEVLSHNFFDKDSQYYNCGYQVFNGNKDIWQKYIKSLFEKYIIYELSKFLNEKKVTKIEDYHKAFLSDSKLHNLFIKKISRKLPQNIIDPENNFLKIIINNTTNLIGKKVRIYKDSIEFRVVRPNSNDNNKLHRDHWFPYFRPLINIYLPICGSDYRSVLRIVPSSHFWRDEDVIPTFGFNQGKTINEDGVEFSTPCIKSCSHEIIEHRPDVIEGNYMLFSPLTVHGGGSNNGNKTRFSLEIRLEVINDYT